MFSQNEPVKNLFCCHLIFSVDFKNTVLTFYFRKQNHGFTTPCSFLVAQLSMKPKTFDFPVEKYQDLLHTWARRQSALELLPPGSNLRSEVIEEVS